LRWKPFSGRPELLHPGHRTPAGFPAPRQGWHMVPDIDPPPDYSLIADRKGKRATDDEKLEIYRLKDAGMPLQQILEITQRSEDSIRRYIREVDAAADAEVRTQAQAYQNMVNPPQRPSREPAYHDDDDDDDYEAPPSARRPGPPPPPEAPEIELDLDDLFDEDDLVDPTEDDALPKKLFVLLLQKKAVKEEEDARDIAQDFRMYPDYHNPHGLVEFLKGHDIKERKANLISRLLFGWQHQSQGQVPFNPGPVPGWSPGMPQPPPGSPGFNQFQQPWGGGYTGYGVPGHQPTLPGQYPFPWPAPPQPPSIPQGKSITKDDVEQLVTKAVKERDDWWSKQFDDREAQKVASEKERQQQQVIEELKNEIREMKMNPPTSTPDGNYEAVETPVYDNEGNVVRVVTSYKRLEDPQMVKLQDDYKALKDDMKEERKQLTDTLNSLQTALSDAKTDQVRVQLEGQKDLITAKMDAAEKAQDRLDKLNERLHDEQMEKLELQYANTGELSESMQIANMQKDLFQTALTQAQGARRDLTNTLLIMSGKGRPANVAEEQWSDEELAGIEK
jgi:hypothetical protein